MRTSQSSSGVAGGHGLGGIQREPAGEDRQPPESTLLRLVEEIDGSSPPTPAASAGAAAPCGRRRSAAGSGRRAASRICSGLSDATRAAASSMASGIPSSRAQMRGHRRRSGVVEDEVRAGRPRGRSTNSRTASYGQAARPATPLGARRGARAAAPASPISPGTPSGSRLVASTRQVGARRSSTSRQRRGGASRTCSQLSSTSSTRLVPQIARRSRSSGSSPRSSAHDRAPPITAGGTSAGSASGREVDPPHPVRDSASATSAADLEREAGLAAAARAGERDQAVVGQQSATVVELALAADEAGELGRQVVGQRVERAQRREARAGSAGMGELEDALGPARGPAGDARRDRRARLAARRVGQQVGGGAARSAPGRRGPAPRSRAQRMTPGRRSSARRGVAASPVCSAMRTADGLARRPGLVEQGALGVERGGDRVGRPGERRHQAVALALLEWPHAAVRGHGRIEDLVVPGDGLGHRRRLRLPQRVEPSTSVSRKVTVPPGRGGVTVGDRVGAPSDAVPARAGIPTGR